MPVAYIALGANLGDRAANLRAALHLLAQTPGVTVTRVSTLIENPAVGGPVDSPPFLNGAAELQTTLPPQDLLAVLLQIERSLGRIRSEKWGPRTVDLDLLLYENQILSTPHLELPHPRMHERAFVLTPLAEIAPDFMHPTLSRSVGELASRLSREDSPQRR